MPKDIDHIKITDTQPRVQFVADGVGSDFPFTFQIIKESDLQVYINDEKQDSNYTVSGAGETSGGAVVFSEPPGAGTIVTLVRNTPIRRTSDFQQSGMFQAKVLNDELDLLTAALQDVAENVRRSVKLSVVDADADLELPAREDRANNLLGFSDDGNATVTVSASSGGGEGSPGGADESVQFNEGGEFGGASGLTYSKSTNTLNIGGGVKVDAIAEKTAGAGVTVEGLVIKDGLIDGRNIAVDGAKLDGVEAGADVTDAANVKSAGAVMNGDASTAAMEFVINDDSMAMASDTTLATSKSVKAYVDAHGLADGEKGDITVSGDGRILTLGNSVVTNAKAADMAQYRIKGRIAAGSGDPEDLTAEQVRAIADVYSTDEVDDLEWDASDIVSGILANARVSQTNVTQHAAAIDHNVLANFVANQHIDWTSATADLSTTGTINGRNLSADGSKLDGIEAGATGDMTGAEIKVAYEGEANTNTFTDADAAKLAGVAAGAQANRTLASRAEAEAGTDNSKDMTPLRVAQAITALAPGGGLTSVATVAAMSALNGASHPAGTKVLVNDYAVDGDGGGGWFEARDTAAAIDNGLVLAHDSGGSIRWHRLVDTTQIVSVRWFGARGDGVTDDLFAIQAAINSGAKLILFSPGEYRVTSSIEPLADQRLSGVGGPSSVKLRGDDVTGGILSLNTNYDSADKPRIIIEDLLFVGSADYGVFAPSNTGLRLHRLRFSFGMGALTYDCIHAAKSWDSRFSDIRAYTESGRAVIWLDGSTHGLRVSSVHTTAQTQYGIVVSTDDSGEEVPAGLSFSGILLQRHHVGLWLKQCRGVDVTGFYGEACQIPLRLGDDTSAAVSVTISAQREALLDATAQGWADNRTAVVEAIRCSGVTLTGFKFDSIDTGEGHNALYIKQAKSLALINCTGKGANPLKDWTDFIVLAPDAARDNTIRIEGNGDYGNEWIRPNKVDPETPNSHSRVWFDAGALVTEEWTPAQHLPDPTFACSLSRYLVAAPGTKQEVVRLRRSSDDDTRDFYLDAGILKRTDTDDSLAIWAGADTIYGVRWYDQSDNSAYMEQTDPAQQPVLTASGIDGKASWLFDGATAREFDIPDGWVRPHKCTAFIVAEHADGAANDEYVLGSTGGGLQFSIEAGNGTSSFGWGIGTNPTTSGAGMSDNNPAVLEAWVDDLTNASSKFGTYQRVNRASGVSGQTAGNSTSNTTVLRLGTRDGSTYFAFDGEIAEFQSFHYSLSLANRDTVSQSAMDHYSIG